jgi:hypothetical protein
MYDAGQAPRKSAGRGIRRTLRQFGPGGPAAAGEARGAAGRRGWRASYEVVVL